MTINVSVSAVGNSVAVSTGAVVAAHAASHAAGGADAITPANIGAAGASHTHLPSQVSSSFGNDDLEFDLNDLNGAIGAAYTYIDGQIATRASASNSVVYPAQITADQNNYSTGVYDIVRISSNAARNITGIVAASNGDARLLVNVGSFDITLKHQSTSSTSANRLFCAGASDFVLVTGASVPVVYDSTSAVWRVG